MDAGESWNWDELAREASRRALTKLESPPDRFDQTLRSALGDTEDLSLRDRPSCTATSTPGTSSLDEGRVSGVFDWDIACPGEWRFDLVNLAFDCQMYPKTCEPDALEIVIAAVHERCDAPPRRSSWLARPCDRFGSFAVVSLTGSSLRVRGCRRRWSGRWT